MDCSKFDKLIYLTTESGFPVEQVMSEIVELFPLFDPGELDTHNDQFLTDYRVDLYQYNRSLGLPVVEVAQSLQMSVTLLQEIFKGSRVSLEKLVLLARAENYAMSSKKAEHLGAIEKANGRGSSVTFLEKAYGKTYGDRHLIDVSSGFDETSDNSWNVVVHHVENKVGKVSTETEEEVDE